MGVAANRVALDPLGGVKRVACCKMGECAFYLPPAFCVVGVFVR